MSNVRKGTAALYLQAKKYFFSLRWVENYMLIEAVNKNELTKCYRGELKSDEKTLKELFNFLEEHSYRQSLSDDKGDELSLIITVIDMTDEGKGYKCRIIFNDTIKEVKVEPYTVSQAYFLTKKIQSLQFQKKNDRLMMASFGNELTKKLEQKDQDIKKTLTSHMHDMISAVTTHIEKQFEGKRKKPEEEEDTAEGLNMKLIEKKLTKKIKKKLRKEKKERRNQKKKKRKARRKEMKRLQALLLLQQAQSGEEKPLEPLDPQIKDGQDGQQQIVPQSTEAVNLQNLPFHNQHPHLFVNVDDAEESDKIGKQSKKKKKKEKHRHQRAEDPVIIKPQVTSLNGMGKLRNRGGDMIPAHTEAIEIKDGDSREKKDKKSKEKKSKKQRKEKLNVDVRDQEHIDQQNQLKFFKRLEEIRKKGNINEVTVQRANKMRLSLAPTKQPLTEVDEFNPNYNGQPKYKPFVGLNEYQAVRPGEIFVQRMEEVSAQCKKVPIVFREEIPSFKNFEVNGNIVKKRAGLNYQQMVFDYFIPQSGRHVLTLRIIDSKRMYIWFGVIDESYNKKNCITFSFRTGHIATSNKWSKAKTGRMQNGLTVRMQVDMDKNSIIWYISDGRNSISPIPKLIQKLKLVPYFEMMDVGDQICFQE